MGAKQINQQIVTEVIEELDLVRPSIEADEHEALFAGMPVRSIVKDEAYQDWNNPNSGRPTVRPAESQMRGSRPHPISSNATQGEVGKNTNGTEAIKSQDFGVVKTESEKRS